MSKAMTFDQLQELIKYIAKNNSAIGPHRRSADGTRLPVIKYMKPGIDFRTNTCYRIELSGFGWTQAFEITNEFRNLPQSLLERVMHFLDNPRTESAENEQQAKASQDHQG